MRAFQAILITVALVVAAGAAAGQGGATGQRTPVGGSGAEIGRSPNPPGYQGPAGGGTPGFEGPSGGGTVGPGNPGGGNPGTPGEPEPGPPSGPSPFPLPPGRSPQPAPPGTPGGGGVTPPAPGAPQPPIGPLPPGPGDPPDRLPPDRGRTAMPYGLPYPEDRWENWWILNRDAFLDIDRNYTRRALAAEFNSDVFLGARDPIDAAAPVDLNRRRARERLIPVLTEVLKDPRSAVRGEAALALGKIGEATEVAALAELLKDGNKFVRQMALLGLGLTQDRSALLPLIRTVTDRGQADAERTFAALALGVLGREEALVPLASVIAGEGRSREVAAGALYAMGFIPSDESVLMLEAHARDRAQQGALRAVAVLALGKQRRVSEVRRLLAFLDDPEVDVRRSAALALGAVDFESPLWQRRDEMVERLKTWEARRAVDGEARRAMEDHLAELERRAAAEARHLSGLQAEVVDALARALDRDSDRMVRNFAAIALGRLDVPEARMALANELRKGGGSQSTRAFVALGLGVARAEIAGDMLQRALTKKGTEHSLRGAIALALGLVGNRGATEDLRALAIGRSDPTLRANAAVACGLLNDFDARDRFRAEVRDERQSFLRPAFALALALLGDTDVVGTLKQLCVKEASSTTKVQAVQSLGAIRDLSSLDALIALAADAEGETIFVRSSAIHAAGQVAEKGDLPILEPLARDWNYLLPFASINDALLR